MDPFKVLGLAESALRGQVDFDKARQRSKDLYKHYLKANRPSDAKRVEQAFELLKRKFKKVVRKSRDDDVVEIVGSTPVREKANKLSRQTTDSDRSVKRQVSKKSVVTEPTKLTDRGLKRQPSKSEAATPERKAQKTTDKRSAGGDGANSELQRARAQWRALKQRGAKPDSASTQTAVGRQGCKKPASGKGPLLAPTTLRRTSSGAAAAATSTRRRTESLAKFVNCSCGESFEAKRFRRRHCPHLEGFVCPGCRIKAMDPFNPVHSKARGNGGMLKLVLVQPPVVKADSRQKATFSFKRDLSTLQEWRKQSHNIEVRMVSLEDYKFKQTWPKTVQVSVNGRRIFNVAAPEAGHRRRDVPQRISADLKSGMNKIEVSLTDDYVHRFAFALVRTYPQLPRQMCKLVAVLPEEQSKQRIVDLLFSSMLEGSSADVQCPGFDRSRLVCPISMARMKTPVRGYKCQHVQCFDLEAYLITNLRIGAFNKRWSCPVCELDLRPPKDLFIDTYIMRIQAETGEEVEEIVFDQNGNWTVSSIAADVSDSDNEAPKPSPLRSPEEDEDDLTGIPAASPAADEGECEGECEGERDGEGDGDGEGDAEEDGEVEGENEDEMDLCGDWDGLDAGPGEVGAETPGDMDDASSFNDEEEDEEQGECLGDQKSQGDDFVDPMVEDNYLVVELQAPIGVTFKANKRSVAGVSIASLDQGGSGAKHGRLRVDDQLVGVQGTVVKGQDYESCCGHIANAAAANAAAVKLTVFRGKASSLYSYGSSFDDWLSHFMMRVANDEVPVAGPADAQDGMVDGDDQADKKRPRQAKAKPADFTDPKDVSNYIVVELPKPMGVVFEANTQSTGGVFIASFVPGGAAAKHEVLQSGDQLVGVGNTPVLGQDFDTCIGHITADTGATIRLVYFRGSASSLYFHGSAFDDWIVKFMAKVGDGVVPLTVVPVAAPVESAGGRSERPREKKAALAVPPDDFVDPMDEKNYVVVEVTKPMGIVFEANSRLFGGVFIASMEETGAAARHGKLQVGDQLVGVYGAPVTSQLFDTCMGHITDGDASCKLTLFRGGASSLYFHTGNALERWIAELMAKVASGGISVSAPIERRRRPRVSMPITDGSDSSDCDLVSDDNESDVDADIVPDVVAARFEGVGLDADLQVCVASLPSLAFDGPPQRVFATSPLVRAIVVACIRKNSSDWVDLERRGSWRRAAGKKVVEALNSRMDKLEAAERQKRLSEREAARNVAENQTKPEAPIPGGRGGSEFLRVEPAGAIIFSSKKTTKLTLTNTSTGCVAYRVRTNAPKFFLVQPCAGTLQRHQRADVRITLAGGGDRAFSVDFLVQAVEVLSAEAFPSEKWSALDKGVIQGWPRTVQVQGVGRF